MAIKVTTTTDNSISNKFRVRFYQQNVMTKWSATNFMILEGDYTNIDIPYFEGMKSVENPVYHSVGKNLSPVNTFTDTFFAGSTLPQINKVIARNIEIAKDKSYIVSCDTDYGTSFLGRVLLSDTPLPEYIDKHNLAYMTTVGELGGKEVNWNESFSGYKYAHITTGGEQVGLTLDEVGKTITITNIQLEQGTQPTEYEPYKESILSTPQGTVLRGVGSYKDMMGWNDGTIRRKCVEFTISGDEGYNWQVGDDLGSTTCFILPLGSIGLSNKIVPGATTVPCICDKIPWQHAIKDYTHLYFNSTTPYSNSLLVCLEKTKLSSVNSQSVNDYIKSIGGLTIVAPLANTEYEDVEITGGGNWNKIVLDGSEDWSSITDRNCYYQFQIKDGASGTNANNDAINCYSHEIESYTPNILWNQTTLDGICFNKDRRLGIRIQGINTTQELQEYLQQNPITLWYTVNLDNITNTDVLIFNHGTLYTTTDTHPINILRLLT